MQEVETFLSQRKYHELFIAQGGLGVLKSWLEPYQDGSLPNVRVRTSVLKVLQVRLRSHTGQPCITDTYAERCVACRSPLCSPVY